MYRYSEPTRVTIEYCPMANYLPVAQRLAREIGEEFRGAHVTVELVPSKGGVYEVSVNGRLVFSKRATYRLPEADEVFYHVRAALPGAASTPPTISQNST